MKLLFCRSCLTVHSLTTSPRSCDCGKSTGYYIDSVNAVIKGPAVPLGFANSSFIQAINNKGTDFTAFTIDPDGKDGCCGSSVVVLDCEDETKEEYAI